MHFVFNFNLPNIIPDVNTDVIPNVNANPNFFLMVFMTKKLMEIRCYNEIHNGVHDVSDNIHDGNYDNFY